MPDLVSKPKFDLAKANEVQQFSGELQKFVAENNLMTVINTGGGQSKHVNIEGWQFAGSCFGMKARVSKLERTSERTEKLIIYYRENKSMYGGKTYTKDVPYYHGVYFPGDDKPRQNGKIHKRALVKMHYSYICEVELFNWKGELVQTAYALCSNSELKKVSFDEYAVMSMAQTRATGKAYRLFLGFVFKLAGFSATPKEEMEEFEDAQYQDATPKRKPKKATPTEKTFSNVLESLKNGSFELQELERLYEFTDDQNQKIKEVMNAKK